MLNDSGSPGGFLPEYRCSWWFGFSRFGRTVEKRLVDPDPNQPLLTGFGDKPSGPALVEKETVTYQRRKGKRRGEECVSEQGLRFDDSVPIETIPLSVPEAVAGELLLKAACGQ